MKMRGRIGLRHWRGATEPVQPADGGGTQRQPFRCDPQPQGENANFVCAGHGLPQNPLTGGLWLNRFAWVTQKLKSEISIPLCTSNRINMPEVAEQVLADGCADMVSMARPFLADENWVKKAKENRADEEKTHDLEEQLALIVAP